MGDRFYEIRDAVLLFAMSAVFLNLEPFSLLFVAPLLLYAIRYGERRAIGLIVMATILLAAFNVLKLRSMLTDRFGVAVLLVNMHSPLSLSAAGIAWLMMRGERRLLRRLTIALLPSLFFLLLLAVFIFSDRALPSELYSMYGNALAALLGPMISLIVPGVDVMIVIDLVLMLVMSLVYPVLFAGICASLFIYESARHSRESGWEDDVMSFSFPQDAIWGFIISWALVLVLRFVSAPLLLGIAVMNLAGVWTLVYAIQGFTVVYARIRMRNRNVRSITLFIILAAIGLLIPGINLIVLIGVPALGVLETFFDLKKIGEYHEDHS